MRNLLSIAPSGRRRRRSRIGIGGDPLRQMVEPCAGKPGDRPRPPHRSEPRGPGLQNGHQGDD